MYEDETALGVRMPSARRGPLRAVLRRMAIALAMLLAMFVLVAMDLDGYHDNADGEVSLLDALYYATVIHLDHRLRRHHPGHRRPPGWSTSSLITPLRIVFLIVLVGTTLEVLTERSQGRNTDRPLEEPALQDHTRRSSATAPRAAPRVAALLEQRPAQASHIVVVDPDPVVVQEATADGFVGVVGDAHPQRGAQPGRDRRRPKDHHRHPSATTPAALVTLTARSLNAERHDRGGGPRGPRTTPLLRQSGADVVIISAEAAGRMLGVAAQSPAVSSLIEDLLAYGKGLDVYERAIQPTEVGKPLVQGEELVVAVVRDGTYLTYTDPEVATLRASDRLVLIQSPPRRE